MTRPKVWRLMGRVADFNLNGPSVEPSTDYDGPPVFDDDDNATMSISRRKARRAGSMVNLKKRDSSIHNMAASQASMPSNEALM